MGAVNLRMMGRTGNQLFQYAFAKAYCERGGHELRCDPWDGERVFDLGPCVRIKEAFPNRYSEQDYPKDFRGDIELHGYFQSQDALIYTRSQVKEWLQWKSEARGIGVTPCAAHYRCGDYLGYGYPVVSKKAIASAITAHGLNPEHFRIVSEETPSTFRDNLPPWLGDFLILCNSLILFRANSSFSWWAATLAPAQLTFSPLIENMCSGEHDNVPFVLGNHPRLASLPYTTDLHLAP